MLNTRQVEVQQCDIDIGITDKINLNQRDTTQP